MSDGSERIADGLRGELSLDDRHPEPEELIAYHRRELPSSRHDEVQEHLAGCPDCAALVLEFAEHWQEDGEPWHRRVGPLRILAAAGLTLAVGLGVWSLQIASNDVEVGSAVVVLTADSGGGDRGGGNSVQLSANGTSVLFLLDVPAGRTDRKYGLEIFTADEHRVTELEETVSDGGSVWMVLRRSRLRPGDYQIRMWSLPGGGEEGERVATFSFTVGREAPSF